MKKRLKSHSKKFVFIFLMLPLWGMLFHSTVYSQEMTGRQIMEEQKNRQSVDTEYGEEIMMLVDGRSGTKEKREIKRYGKKMDNDLNRYLLVFTGPADIKGTALLTHEQEAEDDQWLYMPATQKMQRIASASKKSYFMGTDFTYEDMEPEKIENFQYTILKDETLDQVEPAAECWVIEALPSQDGQKRSSGYSKRILWVDKANFTSLKVEFYDRRKRLLKTQRAYEIQNISGTVFRPKKVIMDNHKKNHKTLCLVRKRLVDSDIKDQIFTERFILSNQHDN
ncbi:outer membrane lipoprotein-sorting protein [Desulfospira joergensenii]|uniref:outer membrane lipoprotein-sorting protein n=1 Tax=Desulfospira joergensenii TaxID=53329 RepID=UPI0003B2E9CC|nr:outer membrane lipoprotein-sorting protein [Desulfospira joergensenii]